MKFLDNGNVISVETTNEYRLMLNRLSNKTFTEEILFFRAN